MRYIDGMLSLASVPPASIPALALEWLHLLLLNLAVGVSVRNYLARLPTIRRGIEGFLSAVVLFSAQVILTEEALGVFRILTPGSLLMLNLVLAAGSCFLPTPPEVKGSTPTEVPAGRATLPFPSRFLVSALIVLVIVPYLAWFSFLLDAHPQHWDDWTYHFRFPAEWLQSHSLDNPISAFGDVAPTYSPMNTELLNYWFLASIRSDGILRVLQHLFLVVLALTLYAILRGLGLGAAQALVFGVSFSSTPYLITQGLRLGLPQSTSHDITATALFLLALHHALVFLRERRKDTALLVGMALGLYLGSKYVSLLFGGPVLAWVMWRIFVARTDLARRLIQAGLMAAGIFGCGGFTYVRNIVLTGNPVYPAQIRAFGQILLPGIYTRLGLREAGFHAAFSWKGLLEHRGFLGEVILLLCAGCLVQLGVALWRAMVGREKEPEGRLFLSLLPFVVTSLFVWIVPHRNYRFLFISLACGYLSAGLLAIHSRRLRIFWSLALASLVPFACARSLLPVVDHLAPAVAFLVGLATVVTASFLLSPTTAPRIPARRSLAVAIVILGAISSAWVAPLLVPPDPENPGAEPFRGQKHRMPALAPGWSFIHTLAPDDAAPLRIAAAGINALYPLYGNRLRNRVFYVPIIDTGTMPHHYADIEYRRPRDVDEWLGNLVEFDIDLLVLQTFPNPEFVWTPELHWASRLPDRFDLMYGDEHTRVYSLRKTTSPSGPRLRCGDLLLTRLALLPERVCKGGEVLVTCTWEIPPHLRRSELDFFYTLEGCGELPARYPSPGPTPFAHHRLRFAIPESPGPTKRELGIKLMSGGEEVAASTLGEITISRDATEARVAVPLLLSPADSEGITPETRFDWAGTPGAIGYSVEMGTPTGTKGVLKLEESDLDLHLLPGFMKDLPPGIYSWRVAATGACGRRGRWSESREFLVP